jgi:DUF1680 family protein
VLAPLLCAAAPLTDTSASPHAKLSGVGLGEARWTDGLMGERFDTCRREMVPNMWRIMEGTEQSQYFENFRIAAGLAEGRHRGPKFNDGDFYKWLESAAAVYAITKDEELDRLMDRVIDVIAKAQRADGYLHTPVLLKKGGNDARPFANPLDFEMYNMGHLITAACVHHRATGKTTLLVVARKAADFLAETFREPTPELAVHGICPSHLMGLVELYRTTRDRRYLQLAGRLIDMRDQVKDGTDDNQDRLPFRKQTTAAGHAVRANYLYAGAADVYAETGDAALMKPLQSIWQDLVSRKLYITGGCGALYDGASPDGAKDQKTIARVHQAYGRDYQLPQATAHNETCAAVGSVLWNWRMLQLTGEARFADLLELTLYNSVLAGVGLDGKRFFYTNPLRRLDPEPVALRWSRTRQPFISVFCCPPNVTRTIAESSSYAYGKSDRGFWVHLYGASALDIRLHDGTPVKLTQETNYPWDGKVRIAVDGAKGKEFSVMLRIPGWAEGASVLINPGAPGHPQAATPGTYLEIRRAWVAGDMVELNLPMPARLVEANPHVEEARNHAAVMRGPIVYCLESTDLPPGVRVADVRLPRDARLSSRWDKQTLAGVTLVEGRALAAPQGDWAGRLYRNLAPADAKEFELKLIPYFAWANRGNSEMSVWLPLGR